jgi:uncharacterized repeat protein (TIGR01451 family)
MKRSYLAGIGALCILGTISFVTEMPGFANLSSNNSVARSSQNKPRVQLNLIAQKKVVENDRSTWKSLEDNVAVQPGDLVRYNLVAQNKGNSAAKKLVVTQPIPQGSIYVLNSTTDETTKVTFSIDGGKTFVANPTVRVQLSDGRVETRPAPAELYSYIRWDFDRQIEPQSTVKASYEVKVR